MRDTAGAFCALHRATAKIIRHTCMCTKPNNCVIALSIEINCDNNGVGAIEDVTIGISGVLMKFTNLSLR